MGYYAVFGLCNVLGSPHDLRINPQICFCLCGNQGFSISCSCQSIILCIMLSHDILQSDVCVFRMGTKRLASVRGGVVFNNSACCHSRQTSAILLRSSLQPSALCSRVCKLQQQHGRAARRQKNKSNGQHRSARHRAHRRFMRESFSKRSAPQQQQCLE